MGRIRGLASLATMTLLASVVSGCSDGDNGPSAPQGNTAEQAQVQAIGVVDLVDAMVADIGMIVAGDVGGAGQAFRWENRLVRAPESDLRSASEPVWNETQQAWIYVDAYSDADGSIRSTYVIQYLTASGVPQQYPDETTDEIRYGATIEVASNGVDSETGEPVYVEFTFAQQLDISALQTPVYSVEGGGTMSGVVSGQGRNDWQYQTTMSWNVDMTVPAAGGCPSGAVAVNVDQWSLVATYDASGQSYAWAMFVAGNPTPIATGYGTSACSAAGAYQQRPEIEFDGTHRKIDNGGVGAGG